MNIADIRALYEYDRWANARVLGAVEKLNGEGFLRDLLSSHRSVRDTLVHILSAEQVWLARWRGSSPQGHLDPAGFPDVPSLRARWSEIEKQFAELLATLSDERLQAPLSYKTFSGEPQS